VPGSGFNMKTMTHLPWSPWLFLPLDIKRLDPPF
jgi:hypothetical protein